MRQIKKIKISSGYSFFCICSNFILRYGRKYPFRRKTTNKKSRCKAIWMPFNEMNIFPKSLTFFCLKFNILIQLDWRKYPNKSSVGLARASVCKDLVMGMTEATLLELIVKNVFIVICIRVQIIYSMINTWYQWKTKLFLITRNIRIKFTKSSILC